MSLTNVALTAQDVSKSESLSTLQNQRSWLKQIYDDILIETPEPFLMVTFVFEMK
jgi:hypothetical protein